MGLFSLFKAIDERGNKVIFRNNADLLQIGALTLLGVGLIPLMIILPFSLTATGSDASVFRWLEAGCLGLTLLGVFFRLKADKQTIDFDAETVSDGDRTWRFDRLACVAITERIQVVQTDKGRQENPVFRVALGFGDIETFDMEPVLDAVATQDLGEEFVAGRSAADEMLAGMLFADAHLDTFELLETGNYPTIWRYCHRLAREAGAAFVDLSGSSFSVMHADDVGMSMADRLKKRGHTPRYDPHTLGEGKEGANISIDQRPDKLVVEWYYSLLVPLVLTIIFGGGITFGLGFANPDASDSVAYICGSVFGTCTLLVAGWLFARHGTYRLEIDNQHVEFKPPLSWLRKKRVVPTSKLYESYVRPHVSGGMSALFLLTHDKPLLLRGKLATLKSVDDAIRTHFGLQQRDEGTRDLPADAAAPQNQPVW